MSKADDLPDFAARLQRIMGQLNFSRAALARELAVDKTVVRRWLAGVNAPTEHNLTRLTEIVRRHRTDFTLAHWRGDRQDFAGAVGGSIERPAPSTHPAVPEPSTLPSRVRLLGLHRPPSPEDGTPFLGLWAGFYNSMANRGQIMACVMRFSLEIDHLRGEFSEGNFSGDGPVIVNGGRMQVILQTAPIYDRLGFVVFNAAHVPRARVIDGIVLISAGDALGTPAASPIVLFRIDDGLGGEAVPTMAAIAPRLTRVNEAVMAAAAQGESGDYWRDLLPARVRELLVPRVGAARDDGTVDHLLRMPASRSFGAPMAPFAALPEDAPERLTWTMLRRLLEIG